MSRTLFIGDVHGCADELAALVREARPTRLILVGDLFRKGPDNLGVWRYVSEMGAEAVMGNHEDRLLRAWGADRAAAGLPDSCRAWIRDLPLFIEGPGWIAVHAGLHPTLGREGTPRDMALVLRRFPDDTPGNPFWWERYTGDRLVIYGHDAVRGLRDHRPRTLGLDTGCVYGGRLTGYLLEEDRLVSVPARRAYRSMA